MSPHASSLSRTSLQTNVLANYLGKLWSVASIYLFVPLYVQMLGVPSYGLVAFHGVMMAVLVVADAGLSAAFSRQAARETRTQLLLNQLRSTELVLFGALALSAAAMVVAAPIIASQWLKLNATLPAAEAVGSLRWMPIALVPQVAMSLYIGGLMGRQRQVAANAWQAAFTTARSAGVLVPLVWSPHPTTFFAWQALCGWAFVALVRRALYREIRGTENATRPQFSISSLRAIGGYAAGMFAMSIISGLNTQLDRLVVSSVRPLEEFSYYTLAATLAQVPTMVTVPVAAALLPRLTQLVEAGDARGVAHLYAAGSYTLAALAATAAGGIIFFASPLLTLWLPGQVLPPFVSTVATLLAIGGLFLALQLMPFQLSLAHGHNSTNVWLGAVTLLASVPLQVGLTTRFGLVGAAWPWLLVGALGCLVLGIVLNKRFDTVGLRRWWFHLTLSPCTLCLALLGTARLVADWLSCTPLGSCALAAASAAFALALCYFVRRFALVK